MDLFVRMWPWQAVKGVDAWLWLAAKVMVSLLVGLLASSIVFSLIAPLGLGPSAIAPESELRAAMLECPPVRFSLAARRSGVTRGELSSLVDLCLDMEPLRRALR